MDLLKEYAKEVKSASGAGVPETSYYPALSNLLNKVGEELKPKVNCVINPKNQGAGIPDGGLFTPDQLLSDQGVQIVQGPVPTRGALEVKGAGKEIDNIIAGQQVGKYLSRYKQVLVTNLREFALVREDSSGSPIKLETYEIAPTEADFWKAVGNPSQMAADHGQRFVDYLKRVMLYAAPLAEPKDVAWFLASYAREARDRIEDSTNVPDLSQLRSALEGALGMEFQHEEGEALFRSTLVQTLFYGVFSAWVLRCNSSSHSGTSEFDWRTAQHYLQVPIISTLFSRIATSQNLRNLGLDELLDWTAEVLNRVDQGAFFKRFNTDEAVQYFYEPFLEAYDPELRKRYGVWYTPQEIVSYMVERVDTALREELGIEQGLAAENVYVLDPAAGTGSYVLEVLRRIQKTLDSQGSGALAAHGLKEAAQKRIFGFELLPAPFVVAHLQIGLMLQNLGVPLGEQSEERAAVYLTNSLTGWETPKEEKAPLLFPEFEEERKAAEQVKREKPILVVLGNPPYDAFAGVSPEEEQGLVAPYKEGLYSEWGVGKFNLDDLYVRFFRLAERRIAEWSPGKGVVCYISNFSYLNRASFVVMREHLLGSFDKVWVDSLNGDSRETGKRTPWGTPDPSAFSTPQNPAGIRVGTAISLMVRQGTPEDQGTPAEGSSAHGSGNGNPTVRFREFWGNNKRQELLDSLEMSDLDESYELIAPERTNRYSLRFTSATEDYLSWPLLTDLCAEEPENGLMEKRGGALIDTDKLELEARMREYHDHNVSWEEFAKRDTVLTRGAARFDARKTRTRILDSRTFEPDRLVRYFVRPFDLRWCYHSDVRPLWNEPRPDLWRQFRKGNSFLVSRPAAVASPEGMPVYFTKILGDNDALRGHAYYFPVKLHDEAFASEETSASGWKANLSERSREYLSDLNLPDPDSDEELASLIWLHALAIGSSPQYLEENADGLRDDWLRVPMPDNEPALRESANLGQHVSALLDIDTAVPGVTSGTSATSGTTRPNLESLESIAMISKVGGGNLNPAQGDLEVRASWGSRSQNGAVMPKSGTMNKRDYTQAEKDAIRAWAEADGSSEDEAISCLGDQTYDVYLNDAAYLSNVPVNVWGFVIGGYQPLKKWLSYKEHEVLGRGLEVNEAEEAVSIARRLAALALLQPSLDSNYGNVKSSIYEWSALASEAP